MAGTDRTRGLEGAPGGPAVILVRPQLADNIGAAARAMLNCGLTALRLVAPRDGWPNDRAWPFASGADVVLETATVYPDVAAATADLEHVYATTARDRDQIRRVLTPRAVAAEARPLWQSGRPVGIMFGPERAGLTNDDLIHADSLVTVPLNPSFASLNLAQAVLLIGYEWFQSGTATPHEQMIFGQSRRATKEEVDNLANRLEAYLEEAGFFTAAEKRPGLMRNIRSMFQRAGLAEQDIRTLHGVFKTLAQGRRPGSKRRKPDDAAAAGEDA